MNSSAQRGLTLIEMLVAIAIFAVVGAIAYTGLDRAIAIRGHLRTVRDTWEARALAYYRLRTDLAQARPRTVRDSLGGLVPGFVIRRSARETVLSFTTGGPAPFGRARASDLRRVDYVVARGRLMWRRWRALDRAPGTKRATLVLMRHIRHVQLRVLSPQGRYVRSWPLAGQPAQMPLTVRVVIVLDNGRHLRWLLPVGR
ncbi:MAG: prepilin-type N-terminal cleavage/methylation domain-containing protein [Gammaproteobacteria bacterium]|nr:prepilin-type N-terminal cleavage/methylation domain-containing protein [Gammaproteobacteria bacterium]